MGQERKPGQGITGSDPRLMTNNPPNSELTKALGKGLNRDMLNAIDCMEARAAQKARSKAILELSDKWAAKIEQDFMALLLGRLDLTGQCIISGTPFAWYLMQGGVTINEEFPCRTRDVAYQLARILRLEVQEG